MVTAGDGLVELPELAAAHLHVAVVEWLVDQLVGERWRHREHLAADVRAVLDYAERLARVAAGGNHPLPADGAWWSSADVAEHTSTPPRTVRWRMRNGWWPSARQYGGRWFVPAADVLDELNGAGRLSSTGGDALAALLPPLHDPPTLALRAVLEHQPGPPAERAELVERFRLARARAELYRQRQARRLAPLRLNAAPEGRNDP
ncbi:hypothetical protein AAG589_16150 [Isoptericola sp. F-RaC21]|uniref:hypothetical protein n=1 Tax=Isoptericola sp. F-RaC21 TaxID=3141452 RepID=UPI00315B8009